MACNTVNPSHLNTSLKEPNPIITTTSQTTDSISTELSKTPIFLPYIHCMITYDKLNEKQPKNLFTGQWLHKVYAHAFSSKSLKEIKQNNKRSYLGIVVFIF